MKSSTRRVVAWLGLLVITFSQLALAAHAFAFDVSASALRAAQPVASTRAFPFALQHCAGHSRLHPEPSSPNLCEAHCSDGTPPMAALLIPPVALVALPVTPTDLPLHVHATALRQRVEGVLSRAPPLAFQFCRLLI